LPTEYERNTARYSAQWTELVDFYDVMILRAGDALAYLNQFPLGELSAPQERLLNMCLSLAEVAFAVENFKAPAPPYLMRIDRFEPLHDRW
jgi:hypothetical protein